MVRLTQLPLGEGHANPGLIGLWKLFLVSNRDQAGGQPEQNSRTRGRNFAQNGTQGEVGVSPLLFFGGGGGGGERLIFILSPHKCKLW